MLTFLSSDLYGPDKLWYIAFMIMCEFVWVVMSEFCRALKKHEAQMLEWCFLATFPCLYVSGHCSVGLKNVARKHFCRHGCSKYLFLEGFWNFWCAEHLLVAFRQLADHVEQALLQTLHASRMVSHPVLQGRQGSCVTANGSREFCIFTVIQSHPKSTWELPFS